MTSQELLLKLDPSADLNEQQKILEDISSTLGVENYRRQLRDHVNNNMESKTTYGQSLIIRSISSVVEALDKELNSKKGVGKRGTAVSALKKVDTDLAAFIGIKAVIDSISTGITLQNAAVYIGGCIEDEVRFSLFKEKEEYKHKMAVKTAAKSKSRRHKRAVMSVRMKKAAVKFSPWSNSVKLHVGLKLIDIVRVATGFIKIVDDKNGGSVGRRPQKIIEPTQEILDFITSRVTRSELMSPENLPCVIPPKDWTSPFTGGYHTSKIRLTLVKTPNKNYLSDLKTMDMPLVYKAVNALQRTPWSINTRVLDVMQECWLSGEDIGDALVQTKNITEVACPRCNTPVPIANTNTRQGVEKHSCFEHDEEAHRVWKILARKAHYENMCMVSKRIQISKVLWVGNLFKDFEKIYFPYQLDFRSRVYAVPNFLNPQGADYAKGLLQFANGKPIKDLYDASWLAVHGANTYGYDKVSNADRVSFVVEMEEDILKVAEDPIENVDVWTQADKPFQFLAFCFEWAGYREAEAKGEEFISHLPIAQDGSCSGIQHFSAMLRDEEGAKAVNLTPSSRPQDIYQIVCDKVIEKLRADSENPLAQNWLKLPLDRKLTKRQVMTLPYGSTLFSCKDYTSEYAKGLDLPWGEMEHWPHIKYMSEFIWESILETVTGASAVMDWLKSCAKIVSNDNIPMLWYTPVGFPVLQSYKQLGSKRVWTQFGEGITFFCDNFEKNQINSKRMQQGVSPNFVHSMDASHLIMTICEAHDRGMRDFSVIHDSFGVHASDTDEFSEVIRSSFVKMYTENDVLGDFLRDAKTAAKVVSNDSFRPPPKHGNLDLSQTTDSTYFFA